MTIFRALLRGSLVVIGADFLFFGGLIAVVIALSSLGLTTIDDRSRPTSLGEAYLALHLIAMGLALAGLGCRFVCRLPYELCLKYDPSRDVVRVSVRTTLRARLTRAIWGSVASNGPDDRNAGVLRLRLTRGSIPVSCLDEIERFIEEVRAMNPSVAVEGRWPTAAEPVG